MKGLKVKKISFTVLALLLFNNSHAEMPTAHCLNQHLEFKCVDQKNDLFSLEGKYQYNGKKFSISVRRAWDKEWCYSSLQKIKQIMTEDFFCIDSEIINPKDTHLTLEKIYTSKNEWYYFEAQ